jgi:Ca2+/H+ antiporter
MYPFGASLILPVLVIIAMLLTYGLPLLFFAFAVTLLLSIIIAIHRSIPRKER